MSVTRSVFSSLPGLVQKSAWDHHFEIRGDVWVKDTSGVLLTVSLTNKHFEMSKISILCVPPPIPCLYCENSTRSFTEFWFSNGHSAHLWGHRKTAATWLWWLIIRVIYLCLDNSTSTLKWPICACGPQVGHLVLHFQETQFQLIAGKYDQVTEKTSWWQTDNAYLVLCAQPPVSKRKHTLCLRGLFFDLSSFPL